MPIFVFAGSLTRPAPNYRAANGRGITSLRFDEAAGRLETVAEFGDIDDASWLAVDAAGRRLYAACEVPGTEESWVASFAIGADGSLTPLNREPTGGQTICHLSFSPDGRFLLAANYNAVVPDGFKDGAVAVYPIGPQGELGRAVTLIRHAGTGPNPARQERAHAHCIVPSPDGRFAYVADLGMDRVVAYALGADGSLTHRPELDFAVAAGQGPRHLVFGSGGRRLFLVSELIPTVQSFDVDPATGRLAQLDLFSIPRLGDPIVQPAGILLADDGHLLVGLRECDDILVLSVDANTGKLSQTERRQCGGATPRDFVLAPGGRQLIVTNQDSDRLTVFPYGGGRLGEPLQQLGVGTPMAIALAATA